MQCLGCCFFFFFRREDVTEFPVFFFKKSLHGLWCIKKFNLKSTFTFHSSPNPVKCINLQADLWLHKLIQVFLTLDTACLDKTRLPQFWNRIPSQAGLLPSQPHSPLCAGLPLTQTPPRLARPSPAQHGGTRPADAAAGAQLWGLWGELLQGRCGAARHGVDWPLLAAGEAQGCGTAAHRHTEPRREHSGGSSAGGWAGGRQRRGASGGNRRSPGAARSPEVPGDRRAGAALEGGRGAAAVCPTPHPSAPLSPFFPSFFFFFSSCFSSSPLFTFFFSSFHFLFPFLLFFFCYFINFFLSFSSFLSFFSHFFLDVLLISLLFFSFISAFFLLLLFFLFLPFFLPLHSPPPRLFPWHCMQGWPHHGMQSSPKQTAGLGVLGWCQICCRGQGTSHAPEEMQS